MKFKEISTGNTSIVRSNIPSGLFVLKHKDLDVAMVQIDLSTGVIEYVLDVFLPDELPPGYMGNPDKIIDWWKSRAIPDSRRGIQQVLNYLGEETNLSLMLSGYGLSLTDHYWMQPIGKELYWKDLNFYDNDFSDELGSLLTDSEKIDLDSNISRFSPSSSVNGEMKKKWIIRDNIRYLLKINASDYGQQAVNERIASHLHARLKWNNYVSYDVEMSRVDGAEVPCSLNPLFTSQEAEFVSAYQLVGNLKKQNDKSYYETIIDLAVLWGLKEDEVRRHLEYTILTDFILTNTDRHFNNFGFLYNSEMHKFISMAPIFDTGNSLFYNREIIPAGSDLLDIKVTSFSEKEVIMLRYVHERNLIDLNKLKGFSEEAEKLLTTYTDMPKERAKKIAGTIDQKIEYLRMFQEGKNIWKKEKYWQVIPWRK